MLFHLMLKSLEIGSKAELFLICKPFGINLMVYSCHNSWNGVGFVRILVIEYPNS